MQKWEGGGQETREVGNGGRGGGPAGSKLSDCREEY